MVITAILICGCILKPRPTTTTTIPTTEPKTTTPTLQDTGDYPNRLENVKVAVLYESITDGVPMGRSKEETIKILNETNTNFIFRVFWKWMPVVDSPDNIPVELLELSGVGGITPEQASESLRRNGHYYQELRDWITTIKKDRPDIIFCGAIPAQTLGRIELNPVNGRVYKSKDTWEMALNPYKWGIKHNGKPVTREDFQKWFNGRHPYGGEIDEYDPGKARAYFPDITNPEFQELLLSWAEKQIDSGADAIWIDMLYTQAAMLAEITKDVNHQSVKDSIDATSQIVDEIHKYGESKGKYIYVGSWEGPFVKTESLLDKEFPHTPPDVDFITFSPTNREIENKKLDKPLRDKEIKIIREKYGDIPVFAFIDWSFDDSPTVRFSQKLSKEEQREVLKTFDKSFNEMNVNFIYPLHGGYMGKGNITKTLSFGRFTVYDSLAPEFQTYETIKELALNKTKKQ